MDALRREDLKVDCECRAPQCHEEPWPEAHATDVVRDGAQPAAGNALCMRWCLALKRKTVDVWCLRRWMTLVLRSASLAEVLSTAQRLRMQPTNTPKLAILGGEVLSAEKSC